MSRKLRLSLAYLALLPALAALVGCGRNWFAQREPWRHDAEVACMKSGAVKEGAGVVRIEPIEGPGICGADFPLRVAALGEASPMAFADDLRPPAAVPGASAVTQPQWPLARTPRYVPASDSAPLSAARSNAGGAPLSILPPGQEPVATYDRAPLSAPSASAPPSPSIAPNGRKRASVFDPPGSPTPGDLPEEDDVPDTMPGAPAARAPAPDMRPRPVPLGRNAPMTAFAQVEVNPPATLACPIVSALDRWIAESVQPAAQRWFGQPVVAIKQISAYSCRGMNGNPRAHISEHAFGNALDIAAFTLADGRAITVRNGWRGSPEEQGFLHDVQGGACEQFSTVLAPGSNVFHYDHIHVDLMRRASGRIICQPGAIPGEVVAARAAQARGLARRGDPMVTGSIGGAKTAAKAPKKETGKWPPLEEEDEDVMEERTRGGPGED
jgi:hypothetical protein